MNRVLQPRPLMVLVFFKNRIIAIKDVVSRSIFKERMLSLFSKMAIEKSRVQDGEPAERSKLTDYSDDAHCDDRGAGRGGGRHPHATE